MKKLSPLRYMRFLELEKLSKEDLIHLCMSQEDMLNKLDIQKKKGNANKGAGKRNKFIENVESKVIEVFLDLTIKQSRCKNFSVIHFPNGTQVECELKQRYSDIDWSYDSPGVTKEKGQQGFYRLMNRIKKDFRNFMTNYKNT